MVLNTIDSPLAGSQLYEKLQEQLLTEPYRTGCVVFNLAFSLSPDTPVPGFSEARSVGQDRPKPHLPLLPRPLLEEGLPVPPAGVLAEDAIAMLICPSWISCLVSAGRWLIFCCVSR